MEEENNLSPEDKINYDLIITLFQSLDKLVRGMQLYEGKGPLVERLAENVLTRVDEALKNGDFTLSITPVGPIYKGFPVMEDGNPPKYLFQLYCDGVRELTFIKGVTKQEIIKLVEVFYFDSSDPNEDMVTYLWKQELNCIRYYAVDTLGLQVGENDQTDLKAKLSDQIMLSEEGTKLKMSSSDLRLLRTEDKFVWVSACKAPSKAPASMENFASRLLKSCHNEKEIRRFVAIAIRCGETSDVHSTSLVMSLVQDWRQQGTVAPIIEVFNTLVEFSQQGLSVADNLIMLLLSKEEVTQYSHLYETNNQKFFGLIQKIIRLENFPSENFVFLLKELPLGENRKNLQSALSECGIDMTELYLDALQSEEEALLLDAIETLGRIGSDRAIEGLVGVITSVLTSVRKAVLMGLQGRYRESLRVPLAKSLRDPDSENRLLALRILSEGKERRIGTAILDVMQNADFQSHSEEEQTAFYNALSKFPSPTVLQYLDKTLSEKNISRSSKIISRQLLAVQCIGKMDSPDAKPMLEKCSSRWFLPGTVKEQAKSLL